MTSNNKSSIEKQFLMSNLEEFSYLVELFKKNQITIDTELIWKLLIESYIIQSKQDELKKLKLLAGNLIFPTVKDIRFFVNENEDLITIIPFKLFKFLFKNEFVMDSYVYNNVYDNRSQFVIKKYLSKKLPCTFKKLNFENEFIDFVQDIYAQANNGRVLKHKSWDSYIAYISKHDFYDFKLAFYYDSKKELIKLFKEIVSDRKIDKVMFRNYISKPILRKLVNEISIDNFTELMYSKFSINKLIEFKNSLNFEFLINLHYITTMLFYQEIYTFEKPYIIQGLISFIDTLKSVDYDKTMKYFNNKHLEGDDLLDYLESRN